VGAAAGAVRSRGQDHDVPAVHACPVGWDRAEQPAVPVQGVAHDLADGRAAGDWVWGHVEERECRHLPVPVVAADREPQAAAMR